MPTREERRAQNEAIFRAGNEAINNNLGSSAGVLPLMCECGDTDCHEEIEVTKAEFEAVHSHPARFMIVDGHEDGDEAVVDQFDRFTVVEKTGAGRDVVEKQVRR